MDSKNLKINKESFVSIIKGDITQFYEIVKKIGEGGFGKIYKVKNKESGDIRAMKQIMKSKIPDIEKFQNEIKISNNERSEFFEEIKNNIKNEENKSDDSLLIKKTKKNRSQSIKAYISKEMNAKEVF